MSINYTRFSRTDSLIIHGPWDHGRRRLGEKKIPKAKKPTMSGTLFFIYTTVYFFDNVVNEIK